jgi:16S rRNA G966 N2-methylase RsmD
MNEIDREYHELSNIFPLMQGAEFEALKADIKQNGLIEPVWIDRDGKIIDGRNRHRACLETGAIEKFKTYEKDDILSFIIGLNLHRRHLNETQRAVVASRIANMPAHRPENKSANLQTYSQPVAAEMLNVSPRTVATVKAVEKEAPELLEKMERGEITAHEASKKVAEKKRGAERKEIADAGAVVNISDRWNVWQGDIQNWQAPRQYDFIITDPPYPREYLPLWGVLAKRAVEWLKPGGLLVAMSGQSYLPEIYEMLGKHLEYYWSAAYLTPGQSPSIWNKNVIPKWKPLLIYSVGKYSGKMFGDVYTSGENSKSFHKWGQSESGMFDVISGIVLPGQYVLDPFCGAGTTGVAALKHGCFFDGIDVEIENVNISKARLNDATKTR